MRILVSAFAISPKHGSEAGVGWAVVSRLAKRHDVTVLFGDAVGDHRDREELEYWLASHPSSLRLTLQYVPPDATIHRLQRLQNLPGMRFMLYAAYHRWQKLALASAKALHQSRPFDLSYQLTIATYREPGYLWKLPCPFFWGPVSGRTNIPMRYACMFPLRELVDAVVRNVLNDLTPVLNKRVGLAAQSAAHIWCVTSEERKFFSRYTNKLSCMLEVAPPEQIEPRVRSYSSGERLEIVWSGLHIPRKALPLLLKALPVLGPDANVHVHLLGGGYNGSNEEAKKLAAEIGVADKITFYGMRPRPEALSIMQEGHIFIQTSVAEGTSSVILEALASGMPVICHNISGMRTAVDETCGIKIPVVSPKHSVTALASAITQIMREPHLLEPLSRGAIERARQFSWDIKVQHLEDAFAHLHSGRDRP